MSISKTESRSNSDASTRDSGVATPIKEMEKHQQQPPAEAPKKTGMPPSPQRGDNKALALILPAALLTLFLVSLDRSIVSTAIPRITDEFDSLDDIGWYGSAYLLTASCFQLLAGRIYTFYSPKYVFMAFVTLFEIGSAVCGSALSSNALIVGRAIAGLGCAGIQNGGIAIIIPLLPLAQRPMFQGFFGAVMGVGQIFGPIIGGAFTNDVSWRWCFYVNLPVGGLALLILAFVLKPNPPMQGGLSIKEQLAKLDLLGELFLFPSIISLLLALQWGGTKYSWSDGREIGLLVVFGVCLIGFILVQIFMPKTATIPGRVVKNRSIISAFWISLCNGAFLTMAIYYIPVWFQAIKGDSPKESGIHLIPLVASSTVAALSAGFATKRFGYYTPFAIAGAGLASVGAGLFTTWEVHSNSGFWIGYQVIFGLGVGMLQQQPNLTAQTVLEGKDVQIGIALVLLATLLGGAIFVSVGENILNSNLVVRIAKAVKGVSPAEIVHTGATDLRNIVSEAELPAVLMAYNSALRQVFIVIVCLACLSFLGAVTLEWRSVKKVQGPTAKKQVDVETGKKEGEDQEVKG